MMKGWKRGWSERGEERKQKKKFSEARIKKYWGGSWRPLGDGARLSRKAQLNEGVRTNEREAGTKKVVQKEIEMEDLGIEENRNGRARMRREAGEGQGEKNKLGETPRGQRAEGQAKLVLDGLRGH